MTPNGRRMPRTALDEPESENLARLRATLDRMRTRREILERRLARIRRQMRSW
jgi:hypothetical protein